MIYDFRMFLCVCVLLVSAPARGVEEGGGERAAAVGCEVQLCWQAFKAFCLCHCFDVCVLESV